MLAYYPHASSNMNGLEFRAFSTNMDLKKLKSQVQSVVLKPSFISRINFLSKDMSQLFSRLNSWKYDRYIYFNPKSTKITIVEAPQNHPNKAVFFVCIKGGIQLKKIRGSQGSVIDNAFWNEWIDKMNTHSHSNKAFGMFQAAQRNLDKTRTKKRIVQGEVQCIGFQDTCPSELQRHFYKTSIKMVCPKKNTMESYLSLVTQHYKKHGVPNAEMHARRLLKSGYPAQWQDYIMIRMWVVDEFTRLKVRMWLPVDHKIYPLVNKLNTLGIRCGGWDQGSIKFKENAFIYCQPGDTRNINSVPKLLRYLTNVFINIPQVQLERDFDEGIIINFKHTDISSIFQKLKLKPSTKQVLPGANAIRIAKHWTYKKMNKVLEQFNDSIA